MSSFITNGDSKDLKSRILQLISKSEELKFLVGFFYFSGIRELYKGLKLNPNIAIKVLVGLSVDQSNFGLIEFSENDQSSDEEKTYNFFESIKKSLNTESFDTKEFYEQVRFFIELIQKDKLIIRKTYSPNHAKLYLFSLEESQVGKKNLFITGSSNLTKAGLSTQNEFNVEIGDYGFEDAEKYFDELWSEAVKITEFGDTKTKLIEILEKETLVKDITPYEAFCLVLKTYLDSFERKEIGDSLIKILERNGYIPYQYQLDAVKQGLAIVEDNNGVIVADVVGLGKTIVACSIAKLLKKRGVIICPPALIGDKNKNSGWKKYLEEFELYDWEVRSRGDMENILEYVNKVKDIEVVVIDEAHYFRNQDTKDYEILKNICRNKQVILLTATPFNNRPSDILSLLSLFITPKKSSITLESNLVDQFKGFKGMFDRLGYIKKYYNSIDIAKKTKALNFYKAMFGDEKVELKNITDRAKYLAKQIRNVIEPVTIRRNRLDLQNNPFYKNEVKELSKVSDPQEWFFELSDEQSEFYSEIIESYFGDKDAGGRFKGAIYKPFEYEAKVKKEMSQEENRQFQQQRNLFDFMRRLLVKRFESSFGSFEQSIKNFKRVTERILEFIEKTGGGNLLEGKYILDRTILERIYEWDIDEIEKHLLDYQEILNKGEKPKNYRIYEISKFEFKEQFISDIKSDLQLYDEILIKLSKLDLVSNDPKTACLIKNLDLEFAKKPKPSEPKRKIIIFTEYVDTVLYLEKALAKHYDKKMLVIANDLSNSKILEINKNFDASYLEQENEFEILLSSDKISEGFNLNRAGMVINYDIPWNPVRVIQRLGRINRISKRVFNELYIVNFFPTEKGAQLVQSREIAANKMFLIHSALGEDSKIFDIDEEPTPAGLFNRVQQNPEANEGESFYTKALNEYEKIKKSDPQLIESLNKYPPRVKVAKSYKENEVLVFFKKGKLYVTVAQTGLDKIEPYQSSFEDVFEKVVCGRDEKPLNWNTDQFWLVYQTIQNFRDFRLGQVNEQSLEQKALVKIETLLKSTITELIPHKDFLRTLKEDILDFGTLPDYTLRRISNFEENSITDMSDLYKELGSDYLVKEKVRQKDQTKEIVIAIENKKHE